MKTKADNLVNIIIDELLALGMSKIAEALEVQYQSPDFLTCDRLTLLSKLIEPEYNERMNKRYTSRLKFSHLAGCPEEFGKCINSRDRTYAPDGITERLSHLDFIRNGMNVCVLGASDSGKTYFAKGLGIMACSEFSVEYCESEDLLDKLADLKTANRQKFDKRMKRLCKLDLLILDDFLLHMITDEQEVKILHSILNSRSEAQKSTVVCSQRMPANWKAMIDDDEIAADAIVKRATKHFTVMIESRKDS